MRLFSEESSQSETDRPTSPRASATSGVHENSKWEPEPDVVVEEQDSSSSSGFKSKSRGNCGDIWKYMNQNIRYNFIPSNFL